MDGTTASNRTLLGPVHAEVKVPAAAAAPPPPPACSSSQVDGGMWCLQKPGFDGLLRAELQRQQQGGRLCDVVLKADGVLVPAHSCVLSAISPSLCSALVSTPPPPPTGQKLLEFRSLDVCTLLAVVRLLYSGEMVGEGEKEKQEAISAAASLGIRGLVEVMRGGRRVEGGGQQVEAGVQTEPMVSEENEGRRAKWRREVRDGCTFLWKETLSSCEQDTWTQTEEVQGDATADVAEEVDSQIPFIPISLLFTPDDHVNEALSVTAASTQHSPADLTSLQSFSTPSAAAAAEEDGEWQQELFQSFQGNISGFINYILKPDEEEGSCWRRAGWRRAGRRREAGRGTARRGGAAKRGAGKPRASTGRRCSERFTQTVRVSRVQKLFLQRSGRRSSRTGQGGGAAGRKLCLKTRVSLRLAEGRRWGWGQGTGLDFSQTEERLLHSGGGRGRGGGGGQRTPHLKQTTPVYLSNINTRSRSRLQPPPSPAASYMPPASSLLHTTALPPMGTPPPEDQPERLDRLLEEVMIGLDIFPKSAGAPGSMGPAQTGDGDGFASASFGSSSAHNKQPDWTTSVQAEGPVLQQQGAELKDMLEDYLQSFEPHLENSGDQEEEEEEEEEEETNSDGSIELRKYSTKTRTRTPQPTAGPAPLKTPRRRKASARGPAPPRRAEEPSENRRTRRPYRRRKEAYHLSLERKSARTPAPASEAKLRIIHEQLRQIPVVKLEKGVALRGHGHRCLEPLPDKPPATSCPGRAEGRGPSPQEEEHAKTGKKRRAESEGESPEDAKRMRCDSLAETTSESTQQANTDAEDEIDVDEIDVDTVSLTSAGEQRGVNVRQSLMCEEEEEEEEEELIVEEGDADPEKETDGQVGISTIPSGCTSPASQLGAESSGVLTASRDDEDIDVIGQVVLIQGGGASDRDEDVDIVG